MLLTPPKWLTRLFTTNTSRVFCVTGEQLNPIDESKYKTLKIYAELNLYESKKISNTVFGEKIVHTKIFACQNDAISYAYHCNLESVSINIFDKVGEKWVMNQKAAIALVSSIDW